MQKHDTKIGIPGFFLFDKNRLRVGLLHPLYHCISLRSSFLYPLSNFRDWKRLLAG